MFGKLKSFTTQLGSLAKRAGGAVFRGVGGHSFLVGLRYAIHHGNPGAWASDHREETQQVTGWNYVAIRAKCIQGMQARISVYQDQRAPEAKALRKRVRNGYGQLATGHDKTALRQKALYGREEDTSEELPERHRLVRLLKQPNRRQSGAHFRYECIQQLESTGTVLIWNVPNKLGLTIERHVIPTAMATPMPPMPNLPHGGWRIDPGASRFSFPLIDNGFVESYGYFRAVGAVIPASPHDIDGRLIVDNEDNPLGFIQAIRWPHPLFKDDGYSPLSAIALWSDLAVEIDRMRWAAMKNQANPSLIITPGDDVEPNEEMLDRAAKRFNDKYGGPENAGRAMFLSGKAEITQLGSSPREMDYQSGFDQAGRAILAGHGTPPIAAGASSSGSYAAFYAELKQFTELTIQPILDFLAEEDTERLAPQFGEGLTIEYVAAAIDDADLLEKRLDRDIKAGNVLTAKEYRALRGLPPFGDARDEALVGSAFKQTSHNPDDDGELATFGSNGQSDHATTAIGTGMARPAKHNGRLSRNGHRRTGEGGRALNRLPCD
ncbi:MAG TPA: phage portal protein [Planctomycetaceae bacterium]|jgi:phage portal protein BeeE|nr:phage portal protein [Planctomycetaceae bacterium]